MSQRKNQKKKKRDHRKVEYGEDWIPNSNLEAKQEFKEADQSLQVNQTSHQKNLHKRSWFDHQMELKIKQTGSKFLQDTGVATSVLGIF